MGWWIRNFGASPEKSRNKVGLGSESEEFVITQYTHGSMFVAGNAISFDIPEGTDMNAWHHFLVTVDIDETSLTDGKYSGVVDLFYDGQKIMHDDVKFKILFFAEPTILLLGNVRVLQILESNLPLESGKRISKFPSQIYNMPMGEGGINQVDNTQTELDELVLYSRVLSAEEVFLRSRFRTQNNIGCTRPGSKMPIPFPDIPSQRGLSFR